MPLPAASSAGARTWATSPAEKQPKPSATTPNSQPPIVNPSPQEPGLHRGERAANQESRRNQYRASQGEPDCEFMQRASIIPSFTLARGCGAGTTKAIPPRPDRPIVPDQSPASLRPADLTALAPWADAGDSSAALRSAHPDEALRSQPPRLQSKPGRGWSSRTRRVPLPSC